MKKLKIAITPIGIDAAKDDLIRQVCDDPTMSELCATLICDENSAIRELEEGKVDAWVLAPTAEPAKCPDGAIEIIITDKTNLVPFAKEPTADDLATLRHILERDFDLRSPRIAIVQEGNVQNPDLASQVTDQRGITTYGPYTSEQILNEDAVCHFDGIVIVGDKTTEHRIVSALSQEAPARYFAGRETVLTAAYRPLRLDETGEGLAEVGELTRPIYTAIDIVRHRSFYDEARKNPLPKLFHDKREDRRKDDAAHANGKPLPTSAEEENAALPPQ